MSVPTHCMLASVQRSTSVRMKLYAMWALSSQYPLAVASQYIYIPPNYKATICCITLSSRTFSKIYVGGQLLHLPSTVNKLGFWTQEATLPVK